MRHDTIHYFGYGSLVNRDTRPADESALNARLNGWQRVWNHRVAHSGSRLGCTSLSISPEVTSPCAGIHGVVVQMPREDLADLDAREAGYERLALPIDQFAFEAGEPSGVTTIHVYRSLSPAIANTRYPILRSYVDCVLAGYQTRFGDDGLRHFLSTTDGWHGSMLDDRAAPRYPRAVALSADAVRHYDELLTPLTRA